MFEKLSLHPTCTQLMRISSTQLMRIRTLAYMYIAQQSAFIRVCVVSCAMVDVDIDALWAVTLEEEEPVGGARKRKRSSISRAPRERKRSSTSRPSTSNRAASDPSEEMSLADLWRKAQLGGRERLQKRKLHGAGIKRLQRPSSKLCTCGGSTGLVEPPGMTL